MSRSLRRNSERIHCCAAVESSSRRVESADICQSLAVLPANHEFWTSNGAFLNASSLNAAGHLQRLAATWEPEYNWDGWQQVAERALWRIPLLYDSADAAERFNGIQFYRSSNLRRRSDWRHDARADGGTRYRRHDGLQRADGGRRVRRVAALERARHRRPARGLFDPDSERS